MKPTPFLRSALLVALVAVATPALAGASPDAGTALHADFELDPTAYALSGNSLHVGLGIGHIRADLGSFALALPQWVHGDDGYDVSFDGFGVKLQYFPRADLRGVMFGIDAGLVRVLAQRQGTDLAVRDDQVGVGVNVGYRIGLPAGFYVTPWIGVGYQIGTRDVTLGGKTYAPSSLSVFPAIHVGYQLR